MNNPDGYYFSTVAYLATPKYNFFLAAGPDGIITSFDGTGWILDAERVSVNAIAFASSSIWGAGPKGKLLEHAGTVWVTVDD